MNIKKIIKKNGYADLIINYVVYINYVVKFHYSACKLPIKKKNVILMSRMNSSRFKATPNGFAVLHKSTFIIKFKLV